MRITDQFNDIEEFEELLDEAELHAVTEFAMDFVDDLRNRYDEYEELCFLSDAQRSTLEKIANGG